MTDKKDCVVCSDVQNTSETRLCMECHGKGIRFCGQCKKTYNKNEINDKDFSLKFPSEIDRMNIEDEYCSNKCFNLASIENDISQINQNVFEREILNLEKFPLDMDSIKKKLEELNKRKEYIINNIK